ncbi:unnamed protein product [Phytophthora lilii]|uniref:Unnamed protein product n=1 Tax=Phytophthora lilii TaxID=2077276 RepID=A0A9W6X1L6_9STRA|nr:unnamed protein product [Phytophthora lilii]
MGRFSSAKMAHFPATSLTVAHSSAKMQLSDEDSDLDAAGFVVLPPPPPPPPESPPPPAAKPRYTGKARIIQSSVFASRDSGRPKARAKKPRRKMERPKMATFRAKDPVAANAELLNSRSPHMLSVVELCNNSDEDAESVATTGDVAVDTPVHSADEDGNESGETADDGWSDHNRCECLDRRRLKKESKEKARVMRETEKLERDARRRKAEQMREEMLAKKSVEAIEHKAKRVLEMQDRILSRKKIKYKDKEEEKLGKIAEDLAQTVRAAKERLEKLEKEDAALRRKEDALNKKKRGIDDIPPEVIEDTSRPDKPTYVLLHDLLLAASLT